MDTQLTVREAGALTETIGGLVAEWLEYERMENDVSSNTLTAYRKGLDVWTAWLQERGDGVASPVTVREFKHDLRGRYAVQTVNLRLTAIRRFYAFMVNTGRMPASPAATVKGVRRADSRTHKRDPLSNGEVLAVLATCDRSVIGTRDRAVLALLAYCGLRGIELHRADIGDLQTQGERLVLRVQGKGRKSKDELAIIPQAAEGAIRAWLALRTRELPKHRDDEPLFVSLSRQNHGERLSLRALRGMVKARYALAGVVGTKSTHSLRHSAITNAIRSGATPMQVQAMARHSSFDTTLGYFHETALLDSPAEDMIRYDVSQDQDGA